MPNKPLNTRKTVSATTIKRMFNRTVKITKTTRVLLWDGQARYIEVTKSNPLLITSKHYDLVHVDGR